MGNARLIFIDDSGIATVDYLDDVSGLNEVSLMRSKTTTLTNAQIKTLPTTPVELIPAPGEGRYISVLGCWLKLDNSAGAYTVQSGSSVMLMEGSNESAMGLIPWEGELHTPSVYVWTLPLAGFPGSGSFDGLMTNAASKLLNKAILLKDDWNGVADYTDGNSANALAVTVYYSITSFE